jgi:hypothetical protein
MRAGDDGLACIPLALRENECILHISAAITLAITPAQDTVFEKKSGILFDKRRKKNKPRSGLNRSISLALKTSVQKIRSKKCP